MRRMRDGADEQIDVAKKRAEFWRERKSRIVRHNLAVDDWRERAEEGGRANFARRCRQVCGALLLNAARKLGRVLEEEILPRLSVFCRLLAAYALQIDR